MGKPKICVVGWYFFENFYEELKKSELDIFVVAHQSGDALKGLKHRVTPNVGLEYGAYNYYINNIWDGKSDVFFMHDDMEVVEFDDLILTLYKRFKKKKVGQGYVASGPHSGVGERFFYMSSKFLKIVKKEHNGMWYDEENLGYVNKHQMPKHWKPNRYNDGGPKFTDMAKDIERKYGFISFYNLIEPRLSLYRRGSDFIKPRNTSADKKKKRKATKTQKKNRQKRERKWDINLESNMSNKVCVAGWHFFDKVYKKIEDSGYDIYVVAHRHNEVLDRRSIKHSVTKNVGLELGAYEWYLKNIWDGKSNVLFMHDDIIIDNNFKFEDFFKLCDGLDYAVFSNSSKVSGGGRCVYMSGKLLSLLIKEFDGIWYDPNDRGYIWGDHALYDDIYYELGDKKLWRDKLGKHFKITAYHLIEKYKLKKKDIICNKISLCVRGGGKGEYSKLMKVNLHRLSDHSVIGSSKSDILSNDISIDGSAREKEGYYKWYDFYFSNIKFENLNVVEIGVTDKRHIDLWKEYFVNSDIYAVNKISATEGFIVDQCSKIQFGVDIIIDNGEHDNDRISLFEKLFQEMAPGGIYVLENLRKDCKVVDYFKDKIDDINFNGNFLDKSYEEIVYKNNREIGFFEKRISSIHFYMGMCLVFKRYCK